VVRIHIPPLRERREDIPLLVNYFLKNVSKGQPGPPKSVAAGVLKALEKYHWPGNVRELENVIRRALVVAKGNAILLSDLPAEITGQGPAASLGGTLPAAAGEVPADVVALARLLFQWARRDPKMKILPVIERELVIQALKETEGNQVHAAKLLGITRATLRKRVEKFGIQRELSIT
jgi:two-component system nitrogen regulation response regulator GlnG